MLKAILLIIYIVTILAVIFVEKELDRGNALGACYGVHSLCRNGSLPDFWQYNSNQTYVSFSTQEIKQASSGCKSA